MRFSQDVVFLIGPVYPAFARTMRADYLDRELSYERNNKGAPLNNDSAMSSALKLLTDALKLLDETDAPADVGAHVDLAIHRLEAALTARSNAPAQ